jgi:hypothetical protein
VQSYSIVPVVGHPLQPFVEAAINCPTSLGLWVRPKQLQHLVLQLTHTIFILELRTSNRVPNACSDTVDRVKNSISLDIAQGLECLCYLTPSGAQVPMSGHERVDRYSNAQLVTPR